MRKLLAILLCLTLLTGIAGVADEMPALSIQDPGPLTEGGAIQIRFTVPEAGECSVTVLDVNGDPVSTVVDPYDANKGENAVWWNGTYLGQPVPAGNWLLCLEQNGQQVTRILPILAEGTAEEADILPENEDTVPEDEDTVPEDEDTLPEDEDTVPEDEDTIPEDEDTTSEDEDTVPEDEDTVPEEEIVEDVLLTDDGKEVPLTADEIAETEPTDADTPDVAAENDQRQYTPSWTSPWAGQDESLNYWTLPMDITDEEAVWKMLIAPVTIIDNGKKNMEKTQLVVRSEPDENSEGLGMVTAATQGVHVLERGDEWSLIECYSSSFHDSPVINWNTLIQGYVPTRYLKEVEPNQEIGIVIDKLTQRLYLFKDGKLLSTLLVSTGVANPRQPYNETRSGEFLLASKVGTFASDNMRCAMAIRFNDGDLLHEVPYTLLKDGGKNYKNNEPKLGTAASHGCIRVQRKKTPEGISMAWIWEHKKKNMKIVIWEDWQGRQIAYPSDDTVLYYNPNGGENYHTSDHCNAVNYNKIKFDSFTYGELDTESYASLTRCEYCTPPLRRAEIDAINEKHAPGGDHDPVLTAARELCPMSNEEWKKIQPKK